MDCVRAAERQQRNQSSPFARSPKHHPSWVACHLRSESRISSLNPKHLSGRFIRAVCPPVWGLAAPQGPRLLNVAKPDPLITFMRLQHVCIGRKTELCRSAQRVRLFFGFRVSGCAPFCVDQKSTRVVAADVSYVITHRQLHQQAITLTTPAWTVVGETAMLPGHFS